MGLRGLAKIKHSPGAIQNSANTADVAYAKVIPHQDGSRQTHEQALDGNVLGAMMMTSWLVPSPLSVQ